jgi:predicted MFS family arabinose efflux permease
MMGRVLHLWAATWLVFTGLFGVYTAPYQISLFTRSLGYDEARAGLLVTVHILALGVAAIAASSLARWRSKRTLVVLAAGLAVGGQCLSILFEEGFLPLLCGRLLAGAGSGLLYAAGNAMLAQERDPTKAFGWSYTVVSVAYLFVLGVLADPLRIDTRHGLFGTALMAALCCVFVRMADRSPAEAPTRSTASKPVGRGATKSVSFLLAALTCYGLACGGGYAFSQTAAESIGMASDRYSYVLGLYALFCIPGTLLPAWVGERFGLTCPMVTGSVFTGISLFGMFLAGDSYVFASGLLASGLLYMMTLTFILGTAARFDLGGRTAVLASGYITIPYAIGPAIFGWLLAQGGAVPTLGWICVVACLVAAVLLISVGRSATTNNATVASEPDG